MPEHYVRYRYDFCDYDYFVKLPKEKASELHVQILCNPAHIFAEIMPEEYTPSHAELHPKKVKK